MNHQPRLEKNKQNRDKNPQSDFIGANGTYDAYFPTQQRTFPLNRRESHDWPFAKEAQARSSAPLAIST